MTEVREQSQTHVTQERGSLLGGKRFIARFGLVLLLLRRGARNVSFTHDPFFHERHVGPGPLCVNATLSICAV